MGGSYWVRGRRATRPEAGSGPPQIAPELALNKSTDAQLVRSGTVGRPRGRWDASSPS